MGSATAEPPTSAGTSLPVLNAGASHQAIDAGDWHTCAITLQGTVHCWGRDQYGQSVDQTSDTYTAVNGGNYHTCAITSIGTVHCWGDNTHGEAVDQAGDTYTAIAAGNGHSCAITSAGTVHCWGRNDFGQSTDQTADTYTAITAGDGHSCAITTAGTVHCWGRNDFGQSTDQTADMYTAVASGRTFSCALSTAGKVHCWGDNFVHAAEDQVTATYTALAAGGHHACAITKGGVVHCWGQVPIAHHTVTSSYDWNDDVYTSVGAGVGHSCAMTRAGQIRCWGDLDYGQAVDQLDSYRQIALAAGGAHTCAVTTTGAVHCWGDNTAGQSVTQPSSNYVAVAAGATHSCALRVRYTVHCWGDNSQGQATDQTADTYTAVAAGGAHTCAVTTTGAVHCWGDNGSGQAADQTSTTYTAVAAGGAHSCAVTTAGTVHCWGDNSQGQATDQAADTYTAVAAGGAHTCAVTTAGTVQCWGDNSSGQNDSPLPIFASDPSGTIPVTVPYGFDYIFASPEAPTLTVESGSLPPGLTLSGQRISGTPTTAGTYPFTVRATSSVGYTDLASTIVVAPAIVGTVTYAGISPGPLAGITVQLYDGGGSVVDSTTTAADGTYSFSVTAGITYRLHFVGNASYLGAYHHDALNLARANAVTVPAGSAVTADARLWPKSISGSVTGTITDAVTGVPLSGIRVVIVRNGVPYRAVPTAADGAFSFDDITYSFGDPGTPNGKYWTVLYWDPAGVYQTMWWEQMPAPSAAMQLYVVSSSTNASTSMWKKSDLGSISGTVTDAVTGDPRPNVDVRLFTLGWSSFPYDSGVFAVTTTAADGTYTFTDVLPGQHRVRFADAASAAPAQWWPDAFRYSTAQPVIVGANDDITGIDIALQP